MRKNESREMYLEVILQLEQKNGIVRSTHIANELGYSKPSVSRAMRVLKKAGFISHSPYEDIILTPKGRKKAERILRAHHLLTEFLIKALRLDPIIAEKDACRIEHVISDETLAAVDKYVNNTKK